MEKNEKIPHIITQPVEVLTVSQEIHKRKACDTWKNKNQTPLMAKTIMKVKRSIRKNWKFISQSVQWPVKEFLQLNQKKKPPKQKQMGVGR